MKPGSHLSSPKTKQKTPPRSQRASRKSLSSGAALGALIVSVPVAAMLLTDPRPNTPPAPQPETVAEDSPPQITESVPAPTPRVPTAFILTEWERLLNPQADVRLEELTNFLSTYPEFPRLAELKARGAALALESPPSQAVAFFDVSEPLSAEAKLVNARALMAVGRREDGRALLIDAWRSSGLDQESQAEVLADFGEVFAAEDHAERANLLLWAQKRSAAEALLSILDPADRALAESRLALQRGSERGGDTDRARALIEQVPGSLRRHPGLIYDQYVFARSTGNFAYARELLADTRIAPGSAGDADKWMQAHLQAAEAALNDRQPDLAYRIAAHHGGLSFAEPLIENSADERDTFTSLEWLAGWIALHDLDRPADALQHFRNFKDAAKFAPTRARGLYWAGRSAEAAGNAAARGYYTDAARYPLTFYGQLAHERAGLTYGIASDDLPAVSDELRSRFYADPRVEAVQIYGNQGNEGMQRVFLQQLAETADRTTLRLVSELANRTGNERVAVRSTRGSDTTGPSEIVAISYPRLETNAATEQQWIYVHGIARQESQFESDAVSHAGARGLLQLMPATAQEQARREGIGYRYSGLTGDPDYNVRLGAAYFDDMIDYWDGSVVLAVASYNAGPGNVRRWVREHGDPRDPGTDVLKWIEEIPFYETKTYVRNVLSNFVVYEQLAPEYRRAGPETERLTWYLSRGTRG
ncbi:hypothetical protein B5C34_12355 [Pacificimonas flava]|uniref:Transglycosylase SLT domain-containing protein n=2 Tax=Pacificimonas TaxID=1960290 RepID=A0A219B705_9SPHN|nr:MULTISPECIES: lytic transglycosylase domain-containing protein [Pacificimonas]MBZ6378542.1 lytic transglycosylase domain-containing protein [Pacificimonas aurantium]OWV34172.1 hypothetical protein B5C34_12355 [Pacificimonas flava]